MARLFLDAGQTFKTIGGGSVTNVVGTNGSEIVAIAADGQAVFDPSFNRGGDTLQIAAKSNTFLAALSGSSVVLTNSAGASIIIPFGSAGLSLQFDDAAMALRLDAGAVKIGDMVVTGTAAPIVPVPPSDAKVPVIVLAGQSNVFAAPLDLEIVELLSEPGNAFEFVQLGVGGTSIFPIANADWAPQSQGELLATLITNVKAAIANATAQGRVADVTLLWVQGEGDATHTAPSYLQQLTAMFEAFRAGIGQADAQIVISPLTYPSGVRTAQFQAAATLANVDIIEAAGATTTDGVHYTEQFGRFLAAQFVDLVDPAVPSSTTYTSLPMPSDTDTSIVFSDSVGRTINTGGGDDRITLGSGNDIVNSSGGTDYISLGAGDDIADGGIGVDTIFGGPGNDVIRSSSGDSYLSGGDGNDELYGGSTDVILGGAGTDLIVGDVFADTLFGGAGPDTFRFSAAAHSTPTAPDTIGDFTPGEDKIQLTGLGALTFIGSAAFGGTGQVRAEATGSSTKVLVNISGNVSAEMIIEMFGTLTLSANDFVFA